MAVKVTLEIKEIESWQMLLKRCGSQETIVCNALILLEWAIEETLKGRVIGSCDDEGENVEKVRVLLLEALRQK